MVTIFANYTIGNMGSSEVVYFTVDTTVHDIAVVNVTVLRTIIGQEYNCTVNATLCNEGDSTEIFQVTLFANTTSIAMQNMSLTNHTSVTVYFAWNTSILAYGNYALSAYAWPVQGETNTINNILNDGRVLISIPGDLNGDGTVDIYDAIILAGHFNQTPAHPLWNANVDINGDNAIDIYDAIILAGHFNQHRP